MPRLGILRSRGTRRQRAAGLVRRAWACRPCRLAATPLLVAAMLPALGGAALAHEQWILTPEQMATWAARPLPDLFATWSAGNIVPILAFLVFVVGWVRLGFTGARELFPALQEPAEMR